MVALFVLAACSSIDCPLNNRVYATFRLDGDITKMEDTLTVAVPRAADYKDDDTVIINRLAGFDSIALPMSRHRSSRTSVPMLSARGSAKRSRRALKSR